MSYVNILELRTFVRVYPGLTLSRLAQLCHVGELTTDKRLKELCRFKDVLRYVAPWPSPHGGKPYVYIAVHAPTLWEMGYVHQFLSAWAQEDSKKLSDSALKDFERAGIKLAFT